MWIRWIRIRIRIRIRNTAENNDSRKVLSEFWTLTMVFASYNTGRWTRSWGRPSRGRRQRRPGSPRGWARCSLKTTFAATDVQHILFCVFFTEVWKSVIHNVLVRIRIRGFPYHWITDLCLGGPKSYVSESLIITKDRCNISRWNGRGAGMGAVSSYYVVIITKAETK